MESSHGPMGKVEDWAARLERFNLILAAASRKYVYLAIALPMGLIDFFVPFAGFFGIATFEAIIFLFALIALFVTVAVAGRRPKDSVTKPPEEFNASSPSSL